MIWKNDMCGHVPINFYETHPIGLRQNITTAPLIRRGPGTPFRLREEEDR